MDPKATITIQFDGRGELRSVAINGEPLTNTKYNLYDHLPEGVLKAIIPMAKMYIYESNPTERICFPTPNGGMI